MKLRYHTKTAYGEYRVIDQQYNGHAARILYAGQATPQSGITLDDPHVLLFDYIQRMFEVALSVQPKRVLILGGGAYSLATALLTLACVRRVDVVEIDAALPNIAREFFRAPEDFSRLRTIIDDGAHYIATARGNYDLVIIDAFQEYTIPVTLIDEKAMAQYRSRLSKNGLIVMNYIGYARGDSAKVTLHLMTTFGLQFCFVEAYPADHDDDISDELNMVIIATNGKHRHYEYLQATPLFDAA